MPLDSDEATPLEGPTVLILEDHPTSAKALRLLLCIRGCRVVMADRVSVALTTLTEPPDWALLDLMLPDGDGREVLREVRKRGLPTRVIVITGVGDRQELSEVARLHPDAILEKPIDFDELSRWMGLH